MNYLKAFFFFLFAISASRFIPHPPNFTNLIALSFYIPALLGLKFLPLVLISFALTDLYFGFHNTIFFTWGSVLLIGLLAKFFAENFLRRIGGVLTGAIVFFLVSNFGVWLSGMYGYDLKGIMSTYLLALPFFGYTIISTLIYAVIIETIYNLYIYKFKSN